MTLFINALLEAIIILLAVITATAIIVILFWAVTSTIDFVWHALKKINDPGKLR